MKKLKCIIVDDDEIDQLMVISFVKRFLHLELLHAFLSAEDALVFCQQNPIDVVFLDVDMPGLTGLELRKKLTNIPVCIFITAHPEHAVESFELETLDFIIKPLKFDRFSKAIDRLNEFMEIKEKALLYESSIGGDCVYIKEGHQQTKVKLHEILYLEALKDYTLLVTANKRHCVLSNIGTLLKEIHFQSFVRVHRSFAVQRNLIYRIGAQEIFLNEKLSVPIGRSYKSILNL